MSPEIAERQNAGLNVEYEAKFQANTTLEQAIAETTNAEPGVQMRSAEAITDRRDNITDLFPLLLWETTDLRFQFRRQFNAQYPLRCRH